MIRFRLEEEKRLSEEIAQRAAEQKRMLEERRQAKRAKEAEARAAQTEEARARIEMRRRKKEQMAQLKAAEERRRQREEARAIEEARLKEEEEARRRIEEEESRRKAREREEEEEEERRREEQEESMRKLEEAKQREARRKEKRDKMVRTESAEHRAVEAIRKAERRRDRSGVGRVPSLKERLSMSASRRQEAVRLISEMKEAEEAPTEDQPIGSALNAVRAASKTSEAPTVPSTAPDPPHWRLLEIVKQWGEKRGSFHVSFNDFRTLFEGLGCFGEHLDRIIEAYLEERHIVLHEELQIDIQDFMEWVCHRGS